MCIDNMHLKHKVPRGNGTLCQVLDIELKQFGSSQESKIEPPLVIDSVWDCLGIALNTINDDDGKTIMGWCKMPVFQCLSQFSKWCRNIFGSTCHGPHVIFKKHSIMHNNGIYIGFIRVIECRIAGELIGLLHLLRLRNILRATIALKEFKEIWEIIFQREVIVLENNEFWKYLFTLCHSLYAPMRIL
jgi:hypothetical protein